MFLPGYGYPEEENPYGSRSIPYGQEGPNMYSDSGLRNPYDTSGPDMHELNQIYGREYEDDLQLQGRPPNADQPPPRSYENLGPPNMYNPEDGSPRNIYDDDGRGPYNGDHDFGDIDGLQGAPPAFDPRRSPSIDSETRGREANENKTWSGTEGPGGKLNEHKNHVGYQYMQIFLQQGWFDDEGPIHY